MTEAAAPPQAQQDPEPSLTARLRRVMPYIRSARHLWWAVLLGTLVSAATEPAIPALLKPLLDNGFQTGDLQLWKVPVTLIGLFLVRGVAGFITDMALAKIANEGMVNLRTTLFDRLLDANMTLFSRESSSSLSNTMVQEVHNGFKLLVGALTSLVKDGLSTVALLAYLLYIDWKLTLLIGFGGPAVAWLMRTASRRLYRLARSSQTAVIDLAYAVEENVLANRVVRLHGAQKAQAERFQKMSHVLRQLDMKATVASALVTPSMQMVASIALSAVICIALWQGEQSLSVGTFASFVTAMLMLIAPVRRLSEVANPIMRSLAALERSFDLLEHSCPEDGGTHAVDRARGHLEWRDVTLVYPGAARPAVHAVSLDIAPGETIAVVGPSGSGKTTLANLLPRFLDPDSGQILLDGHDLREWSLPALRRQLGMVSQEVVMFNDTLLANVSLGDAPDRERAMAALDAANLGELVRGLPLGLDAPMGHNARELSGGQRQRLAIARCLYKDAPVLILDEATSALDNESERLVQQALKRLMVGRTTLIIAHRLSTIENADRVVVLDQGRVAEQGTHRQLLAQDGLYARLHALSRGEGPGITVQEVS